MGMTVDAAASVQGIPLATIAVFKDGQAGVDWSFKARMTAHRTLSSLPPGWRIRHGSKPVMWRNRRSSRNSVCLCRTLMRTLPCLWVSN